MAPSQKTTATPFIFRHSKIKIEANTKEVRLDKAHFLSKEALEDALHSNIPVSISGRTLGIALSLSHPEDLASYSIDAMKDGAWKKVEVTYSRPGPDTDLAERVRCLEKEVARLSNVLEAKLEKEEEVEKTMLQWQTADSVFNAYGDFAWELLPERAHSRLAKFGIDNFATLFYTQFGPSDSTPAKTAAAQKALALLPAIIKQYGFTILAVKNGVSDRRHQHAHPQISEQCLEDLLMAIGLGGRYRESSLEYKLVHHLRANSRKPTHSTRHHSTR